MRKSPLVIILAGVFVLSGCASKPEPTFGQLLGDRASEYRSVKKDWQSGASLKADGQSDIKKGEDLIKRGQRLVERGEKRVTEGDERMKQAEAKYTELTASPAIPALVE